MAGTDGGGGTGGLIRGLGRTVSPGSTFTPYGRVDVWVGKDGGAVEMGGGTGGGATAPGVSGPVPGVAGLTAEGVPDVVAPLRGGGGWGDLTWLRGDWVGLDLTLL